MRNAYIQCTCTWWGFAQKKLHNRKALHYQRVRPSCEQSALRPKLFALMTRRLFNTNRRTWEGQTKEPRNEKRHRKHGLGGLNELASFSFGRRTQLSSRSARGDEDRAMTAMTIFCLPLHKEMERVNVVIGDCKVCPACSQPGRVGLREAT